VISLALIVPAGRRRTRRTRSDGEGSYVPSLRHCDANF
jgi:hypothetical protein